MRRPLLGSGVSINLRSSLSAVLNSRMAEHSGIEWTEATLESDSRLHEGFSWMRPGNPRQLSQARLSTAS